jgi:AraC-like DNA-binding protein
MSATFKQITLFYLPLDKNLFFYNLIPISSILIFDILIVYALLNPVILFGLPHFQLILESQIKTNPLAKSEFEEPNTNKFTTETIPTSISHNVDTLPTENSGIVNEHIEGEDNTIHKINAIDAGDENEKIQLLIQRINDYIEKHQPYRAIEFNILMLSKALHVPQHHLIYVFKIVLKKSFVDFRNELRISYVIKAIESGKLKNLTMDAISSEAGFASRTTFYAVFKKHIGITPGQYIDELGIKN